MAGWHHDLMDVSLSELREMVMDREACLAGRSLGSCRHAICLPFPLCLCFSLPVCLADSASLTLSLTQNQAAR